MLRKQGNGFGVGTVDDVEASTAGVDWPAKGMLIINADDWGGWRSATDAALACLQLRRITSVTAMVFMADSERGARLAADTSLGVGLHLNFNQPFTGSTFPASVRRAHERLCRYLCHHKLAQLIYHPGLRGAFRTVFRSQLDEFVRLYQREPSHFDGHQHMHLCANILLDGIVPAGAPVRGSFSFWPREKSFLNRAYRRWVNRRLQRRHPTTNFFFALSQCLCGARQERVWQLARDATVELMTHPEIESEKEFLLGAHFGDVLRNLVTGSFTELSTRLTLDAPRQIQTPSRFQPAG
jgi:predicted glycoside hydrolase/deacetylase ChbG (UPF0249 family)